MGLATIVGLVIGLLATLLLARWGWHWWATKDEREIQARLTEALEAGDLRKAGDIQVQRGLYREAARIFERGGEHVRAGRALLKLGETKPAAEAFEKGGDHATAAPLFVEAGEPVRAAECFERAGDAKSAAGALTTAGEHLRAAKLWQREADYEKAAASYAHVDKLDPADSAVVMLENAAMAAADPAQKKRLWALAGEAATKLAANERAAVAFDKAGELARAAKLYEVALKRFDMAAAIAAEMGDDAAASRLALAAGGRAEVLKAREARARERGDKDRARAFADERAALSSKPDSLAPGPPVFPAAGSNATVPVAVAMTSARKATPQADARFELRGELGRGGMGIVYRAHDKRLDRLVALKFLPPELEGDAVLASIFLREARAAAALSHPGVVTVFDVGTLDGREYIAMELVEGTTLDNIIADKGPMPVGEALDVMEKVLDAVAFAHGKGVIHRDLKPSNLMKPKAGGIKVMDFGLAKSVQGVQSSNRTLVGGTPAYMPPEQLTGAADHRADVFALGATFYELLTGVLPGLPQQPASMATGYPTPRERVPAVPARLSDLIMRCLEHDRSLRVQDVTAIISELREIQAQHKAVISEARRFVKGEDPPPPKPAAPLRRPPVARAPIPREDPDDA